MLIQLFEFKEGVAAEVETDYDPKKLDIEFVDWVYLKPIHLKGVIEKGPETLSFRGQLTTEIQQSCGRCLTPSTSEYEEPFELFYEIHDKDVIDTTDDIREIFLLDRPLIHLCDEDCRGLCPVCGINRNQAKCRCVIPVAPSGGTFAPLKEIWNQRKRKKEKPHGTS